MGYTALRDKPEKEAIFLRKDVFVSVFSDGPDLTRCCVSCLCLLKSSGGEQQHSEHHFMAVKSICESYTHKNHARVARPFLPHASDAIHPALWKREGSGFETSTVTAAYNSV